MKQKQRRKILKTPNKPTTLQDSDIQKEVNAIVGGVAKKDAREHDARRASAYEKMKKKTSNR